MEKKVEPLKDFVIEQYKNNVCMEQIAKKIHVTPSRIKVHLVKWGVFKPKEDKSIQQICLENNVKYKPTLYRIRRFNMTIEEAIEDMKHSFPRKPGIPKYKEGSHTRACYLAGVCYNTVKKKMRVHNMSLEDAIEACKKIERRPTTGPRKKYNLEVKTIDGLPLEEYAEKYGMKLSTVREHWRILNGK